MTQTYVITGASRGLGLEFVRQLASQEGNIVYAGARNPESSKDLMSLVDNKKVFAFTLDMDSRESVDRAAAKVAETATEGIDVLINNAGIGEGGSGLDASNLTVLKAPRAEYLRLFEVNVAGVSDVTQAFLPLLRKRGSDKIKRIINLSTGLASISMANQFIGGVIPDNSAYKVSKTALNMVTQLFASTLAPESFVIIAVSPGWVATDMGGSAAPMKANDSIRYMLSTFDALTTADNGRFLNYDGESIAW